MRLVPVAFVMHDSKLARLSSIYDRIQHIYDTMGVKLLVIPHFQATGQTQLLNQQQLEEMGGSQP